MHEALFWAIVEVAFPQVVASIAALRADPRALEAGPAADAERSGLPLQVVSGVAIIPIVGVMMRRASWVAELFGFVGTERIRAAIRAADADPDITGIVLRIDSPGGAVSGTAELAAAIAATSKPTVAVGEGMIASAAMWAASAADRIVVGPSDLVGSIGVRMFAVDSSRAWEMAGLRAVPIDTGPYKSAGAPGTEITDEQRADWQRLADFHMRIFTGAVQTGRKLSSDAVAAASDGRMFPPDEAMRLGLVDAVGSIDDVIDSMRPKRRDTEVARARMRT